MLFNNTDFSDIYHPQIKSLGSNKRQLDQVAMLYLNTHTELKISSFLDREYLCYYYSEK